MGSINAEDAPATLGEFMHPVITDKTDNGDPWQRKYFAPPAFKTLVPRTYRLIDVRPWLSASTYSATDSLKDHGFGIVNHHSSFLDQLDGAELSDHAVAEVYIPEIKDLVKQTLGCKHVFVVGSVFRQGKPAPEAYALPTERRKISQAVDKDQPQQHKLATQTKLQLAAPIRVPHMDFTPLGARQSIRCEQKAMYNAAVEAGIIAAEDKIHPDPVTKDSDSIIAEKYNASGPGPRYAAYSIWRPLKRVGRDPLTLAPRKKGVAVMTGGDFRHHFYENKIPGAPELRGDFLKEYAMLGIQTVEAPVGGSSHDDVLKWYYISEQKPDEVFFIKLFDSAALGPESEHAHAPWHASPEIGDAATSDEPRESIDIRIITIW